MLGIVKVPPAKFKTVLGGDFPFVRGIPTVVFVILLEGVPVGFFSPLVSDKFDGEF